MKYFAFFLFFVSLNLCFSCGQAGHNDGRAPHEQAVDYDANIGLVVNKLFPKVNGVIHQFLMAGKNAQNKPERRLDKSDSDSLMQACHTMSLVFESTIISLCAVKEIPKNFNLKEASLGYIKQGKQLLETSLPESIQAFRIGLDNLNDQQKAVFKKFKVDALALDATKEKLDKLVIEFQAEYTITDAELTKRGL